ncbi:6-carboxytetrahydropterin synthase [Halomonas sp. McH1-25]|uniref:6-pyruvoyl trahydropterin synthase family protein n=1 Tax=unclassified Halomonas TaxID=2609666 RepID=UPI001EF62988|nr:MULTISPECIES: 6-carboxytetrahydropterin synthase [unclassified Halomonas]MCG7598674.1 6-carboxytetrahydropterin synthase [Halomonas sp. McH1-25]MCP1340637.1 6-carboxytetrahydropterin synthase [Halomonas sp. FL8]MCP1359408.1 6-carboxytetrahydropterin synthase [Halomonas sp. BBD45]MCP1364956.1 6-carboxytetrahydropterin synthase [Halomonas sp. BBD48]
MTLFVNNLTHLDVSLWCPQRGLIGASWHVDVELDGQLGEDGMLFDFGEVKPWVKSHLDSGPDHTLLVPLEAPGLSVHDCNEGLCVRTVTPYAMEVRGPRQAFSLLPWREITPQRLAAHYSDLLSRRPPPRVESIRLRLHEEPIDGAAFTYSHGLKRHVGNCQRIAHGHRSRLRIWAQGSRQPELETAWAERLHDRYLVTEEDIVDAGPPGPQGQLTVRYKAAQGQFQIRLPRDRCITMPTPTTVEHIAAWLSKSIVSESGNEVRVQAFEGIGKGAFSGPRRTMAAG